MPSAPVFLIFPTYTNSCCSIRILISSALSLEVGFFPASLQSLSDIFRVLYIAPPPLIYAVEFGDVGGGEQHFSSVAATWLYKVLSRLELEPR